MTSNYPFSIVHSSLTPVPEGYKRTEVGVIPEDWDCMPLKDDITLLSGHHVLAEHCNTNGYGVPYLTGPADFSSGKIRQTRFTNKPTTICEPGDILVTVKGSGAGTLIEANESYCISRQLMAIRPKSWAAKFIYYTLLQNAVQIKAASAGLIPGLSRSDILDQQIPVPKISVEQDAIATALSDADALIDGLDRLIAKKRAIKQAAMQQLLTGQTRLPGFEGGWSRLRLGDHVTFLKTGSNSRAELSENGTLKYLHYGDIHTNDRVYLDAQTPMPGIDSDRVRSVNKLQKGDLVFVDASEDIEGVGKSVEITTVPEGGVVAGLHTIAARFAKTVLADGFKAYLQFCPEFLSSLKRLAAGTKVYATNRQHIAGIEMLLPGINEQQAIATVLSDMDAEIQALERRRDKARQIKLGMMQQLLTGRGRLVPTDSVKQAGQSS